MLGESQRVLSLVTQHNASRSAEHVETTLYTATEAHEATSVGRFTT